MCIRDRSYGLLGKLAGGDEIDLLILFMDDFLIRTEDILATALTGRIVDKELDKGIFRLIPIGVLAARIKIVL